MSDVPDLETLKQAAEMRRSGGGGVGWAVLRLEWAVLVWA